MGLSSALFEEYCPGNGSRYAIIHGTTESGKSFLTWLFNCDSGGGTVYFGRGNYFDADYLCEKMQIKGRQANGVALLVFLRDRYKVDVYIPKDYDQKTGHWVGR